MEYQPKMLENPKDQPVEFMCGGRVYIFQPHERRILDGYVAEHAIRETNTGLIEVDPFAPVTTQQKVNEDFAKANAVPEKKPSEWALMKEEGLALGVYKVGMNKKDLEKAIKDAK